MINLICVSFFKRIFQDWIDVVPRVLRKAKKKENKKMKSDFSIAFFLKCKTEYWALNFKVNIKLRVIIK